MDTTQERSRDPIATAPWWRAKVGPWTTLLVVGYAALTGWTVGLYAF